MEILSLCHVMDPRFNLAFPARLMYQVETLERILLRKDGESVRLFAGAD